MSLSEAYAKHANDVYSKSSSSPAHALRPDPGPPPTRHVAIVTCMDARLDVFSMFGLSLGEAHVIRVGGGRTPDALRSLVASQHVLGTDEVMVVHHTDCGFSKAPSEEVARKEIRASTGGLNVDWLPVMRIADPKESVQDDVAYLRVCPYIKKESVITGWVYDTAKGTVEKVA
ncbi:hypothetical protein Q5752_004448 [Cryptotrichosporon argae]